MVIMGMMNFFDIAIIGYLYYELHIKVLIGLFSENTGSFYRDVVVVMTVSMR